MREKDIAYMYYVLGIIVCKLCCAIVKTILEPYTFQKHLLKQEKVIIHHQPNYSSTHAS
jgi:hypothetical protein